MTRTTLPAGINPDLIIGTDGLTVVCYQDVARGFVVERFADPASREVLFNKPDAQGYGRLRSDGAAAFRGADGAAWRWFGGPLIRYGDTLGNYPIAFTEDMNCCVQMPPDFRVSLNGTSAIIGAGIGTGLARVEGVSGSYNVVTLDTDLYVNGLDHAHVLPSGDRVSQGHDGGVVCKFGTAEGTILPTESCYEPRLALQPNGAYTIIFGGRGPHGALPLTVLTDVTAADFTSTQPPIVPLTTPTIFAAYVYAGTRTFDVNGTLIPGQDLVMDNGDRYAVIDTEQGGVIKNLGRARCITGTNGSLLAQYLVPTADAPDRYDAGVFVQCCPLVGESYQAQLSRYQAYLSFLSSVFYPATVGVISFVRTNFQLSDDDIRNGMAACSALGCPVLVFEDDRPVNDVPAFVPDLLKTWRNGQPAPNALPYPQPPQPIPVPPNPEPEMPYKTFSRPGKDAPDYIAYMNDVGQRVGPYLGLPTNNPAPDTHFTSAGQAVNECYDLWDAAQQALGNGGATIPSANIMSQIAIDRKQKNLSADAVSASLKHEVPLR